MKGSWPPKIKELSNNFGGGQEGGVQEEGVHIMTGGMCAAQRGGQGRNGIRRGAMKSGEIPWPPP
eukprot:3327886-Pyramimonas_sp.AAC.1